MKINNSAYKIGKEQAEGVLLIACIYLWLGWKINQIQKGFPRGFRKKNRAGGYFGGIRKAIQLQHFSSTPGIFGDMLFKLETD